MFVTLKLPSVAKTFVATGAHCFKGTVRLVLPTNEKVAPGNPFVPPTTKFPPTKPALTRDGRGLTDKAIEVERVPIPLDAETATLLLKA